MITFFTYSLSYMQRKKGSKRIEMIIKTVKKFKLTVVHFARSNSKPCYSLRSISPSLASKRWFQTAEVDTSMNSLSLKCSSDSVKFPLEEI